MSARREVTSAEDLVFGKIVEPETGEPLIPVIVVDGSRLAFDGLSAIRMQGWANQEAVDVTFQTQLVTFYSRSRGGLWTKGETSGDFLRLKAAYTDCDADSLLIDAEPEGPTCHTGADSCFLLPGGGSAVEEVRADFPGYADSLATITERADRLAAGEPAKTYTQKLLADQNRRVQKLGSEMVELVREECRPDFDENRFVGEGADLLYGLEVVFAARNVPFARVINEQVRRNRS